MTERPPLDRRRIRNAAIGAVALALFAASVGATWFFLKGGFRSGVPISAVFSAPGVGQQLPVGGDVKIKGVLVGSIAALRLNSDGDAVVDMRIDKGLGLPDSTRAEIRSKTVFGQKWVELIPPKNPGDVPTLAAGSVIPDALTTEPLELEKELQLGHNLLGAVPTGDLAQVLRALAQGFSGQEPDARRAIDRGLVALRAVNSRSGELDTGLRQLNEFSKWLDANDTSLVSFMHALDTADRALVDAAPQFTASLRSFPAFLDHLTAFQQRTESDLGRLIEHGATLSEVLAAHSGELTDLVVELEPFTTVWNSGLKQPCAGQFESHMTCWQVYQMPGLRSRGLYGAGAGPQSDGPADPLGSAPASGSKTMARFEALLSAAGNGPVPHGLARLLWGPTIQGFAGLAGAR
ncbi:MAG: phospholipid/cholesterol/gamma-HCH transport system substrate-binding protein [Actinomycetota bacterium]|nr:phospholipid/cholesterol/gamma-HCH transport system substrate-binding protein [Actinomycetota bacterium]